MRKTHFLQISILLLGIVASQTCDRCICPCSQTYCTSVSSKTWVSVFSYSSYGYTKLVLSNDGNSCRPCTYNCKACSSENQTSCTTCMPEFYMVNSTNSCKLCPSSCTNCKIINNITTCTLCSAGTYLDTASGLCRSCPNGAATCDNIQITTCIVGYYLVSPIVCLPCVANCQQCSTADCFLCNQGYYKNSSGGCVACNSSLSCQGCTSISACTSCASGFYLTTTAPRKCLSCSTNCLTCTSSACTICAPGYYRASGICQKGTTIEKCQTYNSSISCSACVSGFYLYNGQCLPCSSNCLTCTGSTFGDCQVCQTGFTLYNLMCLPVNYLTSKSYQLYYHLPGFASSFSGGTLSTCVESVYIGKSISFSLQELAASSVLVTWKLYIFDSNSATSYTITINSQPSTLYNATSTLSSICGDASADLYHIQTTTFTNIQSNNTLLFFSNLTLAIAEVNVVCIRCTSLCAVCTQTLCTKCVLDALLTQEDSCVYACATSYYTYQQNKTCLTLCPATTYSVQSNLSCLPCVLPCMTCNSSITCLSCVIGYYLYQGKCQTTCPTFYYPNNLSLTCEKCVGRCLTCTSQILCLSCQVGFLYQASCLDNCSSLLPGFYSDMVTLACQPCSNSCLTCINSPIQCLTCPTELPFHLNWTCYNSCPVTTYAKNNSCFDCSYPCINCNETSTNCTSCSINYLYNGQCLAVCPDGFYEQTLNMSCVGCSAACKLCAYSLNFCQACNDNYYYYNSSCLSICPSGYYPQGTTCQRCINPCLTCTSSTFCLSCISNFLNSTTGQCVGQSQCAPTFYAQISTLTCSLCSSLCLHCSITATMCTSCSAPLFLSSSSCVQTCPAGFYPSAQLAKCVSCRQPCLTCSNSTACLSCISGYLHSNTSKQCLSYCLAGEFIDVDKCTACGAGCLSCKSLGSCQQCAAGGYLYPLSGQCIPNCSVVNQSYFSDSITSKCLACIQPCMTCTSVVDCESCISGVLNQKRCVGSCPIGTYSDSNVCNLCSTSCFSCVGNAQNCTSCSSGTYLYQSACIANCPTGYYPETVLLMCQQCSYKCSKCVNYTFCQICKQGYLDQTNNCIDTCSYGYFANSLNRTCSPCNSQCSSCTGSSTNCISCSSGYYLNQITLTKSVCIKVCGQTQYSANGVCYSCSSPCQSCSSPSECVTCISGTMLLNTSCVSSCPISTFEDGQRCQKCDSNCGTCLNASYCLTCSDSSKYAYLGNCTLKCPDLFYGENVTKLCVQCIAPCLMCSDKFVCLSCTQGYLMKGYCYDVCPAGTFSINQTCQMCQSPCSTCVFRADYCIKCVSGYYIYNGTCQKTCPQGTYINSGICETCPYPCLTCLNQVVCMSCFGGFLNYLNATCIAGPTCPNEMYNLDGVACIKASDCPANYFKDTQALTCTSKCNLGKYTYVGNSSCLNLCPSDYFAGVDLICSNYLNLGNRQLLGAIGISFVKSSKLYIELIFNDSVRWNYPVSTSTYSLNSSLVISIPSRRLLSTNIGYLLTEQNNRIELTEPVDSPWLSIKLPAYYVSSTNTELPLQTPKIYVAPHSFTKYSLDQQLTGSIIYQISESLTIIIVIVSAGFIWLNRLSDVYIIWDITQLVYLLIFLDVQYPSNLNEFILGLKNTHLYMFPNIVKMPDIRQNSTSAYYAYAYDVNFLRSAGHNIVIALIVIGVYLLLKVMQLLTSKVQAMANYQKLRRFVYKGLLRYRWHYTNDFFFLTFVSVMSFAVVQFQDLNTNYYLFGLSIALIAVGIICYIGFPIFVAVKLYRHFSNISRGKMISNLKCFYRGIQKTNKFGVSLILLRYLRKLIYCVCLPALSNRPLFVLPILMMSNLLVGFFVFVHRPFKKRISNIVNIATQSLIVGVLIIISIMQFTDDAKWLLGWIAVAMLVVVVFGQMFYIFCKTLFYFEPERQPSANIFKKSKSEIRRLAEEFFNKMFPNLKRNFSLDSSDEEDNLPPEDGDSQNSENNEYFRQAMSIQEEVSSNPEHFQHYEPSDASIQKNAKQKQFPKYMIRCVHTLGNQNKN